MFVAKVISKYDLQVLYEYMTERLREKTVEPVMRKEACGNCMEIYAERSQEERVRSLLAWGTAELIVREAERYAIYDMIKNGYAYFDTMEKVNLMHRVQTALLRTDGAGKQFLSRRKQLIANALLEYLKGKRYLNVEGFLRFRADDYLMTLEDFVDQTAEEFITVREYESFLELLRLFVERQERKVAHIHVVTKANGEHILLDEAGYAIVNREAEAFIEELDIGETEYDDMLLSALIILAPGAMTLHNVSAISPQLRRTLEQIFAGRVRLCGECALCRKGKDAYLH